MSPYGREQMKRRTRARAGAVVAAVLLLGAGLLTGCGSSGSSSSSSSSSSSTGSAATGDAVKQDATSKADARNVVTLMEVCYTDNQAYDVCTPAKLQAGNGAAGVAFGSGAGQVEVAPTQQGYTITAHSRSGNTFVVKKDANGTITRSCTSTVQGGCNNGSW